MISVSHRLPQAIRASTWNWRRTRSSSVARVDQALPALAPVDALQPGLAHQPGDPLAVHVLAQAQHHLGVHPRPAVGTPRFLVNCGDQLHQLLIAHLPRRRRTAVPLVITGRGHIQHPAGHRDENTVTGKLADQPERYFGRTFSRAKIRRRPLEDLIFQLELPRFPPQLGQFLLLGAGQLDRAAMLIGIGLDHPVPQT